ncbi:MAG: flagellar export chaperone FliS [Gallionellaceae bacterium]|nr:flagellar export chaperone FliS [Gallionellaceae bacterium]
MNAATSINAYASVGLETGVQDADPHKLILMLYQGALLAVASAKNQMLRREIAGKGASITKAIAIIDEGLKASLDRNAGGELAQNLSALYDYMCQRLLVANLKNDAVALDEVSRLLSELKGAWETIRPTAAAPQQKTPAIAEQPSARQNGLVNGPLTYGRI